MFLDKMAKYNVDKELFKILLEFERGDVQQIFNMPVKLK